MKIENPPHKLFVNSDDRVLIVCPVCGFSRSLSVEQFRNRQNLLKVKCKCGHFFRVKLEFRLHIRKEVELEGIFTASDTSSWRVRLANLSMGGACLELRGKHGPAIGDRGTLEFTLDDRRATVIVKQIIVKEISANEISANLIRCQFLEDRAYQKELGFYLR